MTAQAAKKPGPNGPLGSYPIGQVARRITAQELMDENITDVIEFPEHGLAIVSMTMGKVFTSSNEVREHVKRRRRTPAAGPKLSDTLRRLLGIAEAAEAASTLDADEEDNTALVADMKADAMARRSALFAAGELIDSAALCARLDIQRQSLSKAVAQKRLFRIEGKGDRYWYPAFFADGSVERRDLEKVSIALGELQGDAKWQFFKSPKHSLDGLTPLEMMRKGDLARVLQAAEVFRERALGR